MSRTKNNHKPKNQAEYMIPNKHDILNNALADILEQLPNNPTIEDKLANAKYEYERYISAMDEHAKNIAIGFFKWYFTKQNNFQHYFREIKPIVTSQEIEEKIAEIEGKPIEEIYQVYLSYINTIQL